MRRFLLRVFGRRVAVLFGGVSCLSVAVLVALYLTAGYAIESYVSEQVDRLPWDVTVLQGNNLMAYTELQEGYRASPGIVRVEAFGFLRLQRGNGIVGMEIDGKQLPARWIALVATTDASLLPPALRATDATAGSSAKGVMQAQVALVTGSSVDADPVRIDAGSTLRFFPISESQPGHDHGGGHSHSHGAQPSTVLSSNMPRTLFQATVAAPPSQMERLEFNRWMLNHVGSLSYLPEHSAVVAVSMDVFENVVPLLDQLFVTTEGVHGGEAAPPYLPELTHLIRLDRSQWVSTWDLGLSLHNLSPLLTAFMASAHELTFFSYLNSDLQRVLSRMAGIKQLVGIVTLLIAIPLLWLVWVVAKMLGGLLLMNERRLIGLALIRGVPMPAISQTLMLALVIGGLAGGVLGLIAGVGLPVLGYSLAGHSIPPASVFLNGLVYFLVFIALSVALALLSGWTMIRRLKRMTPREAMARVAGDEMTEAGEKVSWLFILGSLFALLLGGYKICAWVVGHSLLVPLLRGAVSGSGIQVVMLAESLLNFVAVPLFLAGVVGVLRWRLTWFQHVLNALTAPVVGKLHWFVAKHMAMSRARVAGTLFLASLAMSLALLPQVAADTFYDRVLRGVQSSVGSEVQLEFNLTDLAGGKDDPAPVPEYNRLISEELSIIQAALEGKAGITSVARLQQYIIPGIYLPTQSGLMLNLIEDTERYERAVYYEEGLGLTQPFSQIIDSLSGEFLTTSQGFLRVREVPLQEDILFGYVGDYQPVTAQLKDVVAFLPGQPSSVVSQREGYATAEIDYLNYTMSSDARIFATTSQFTEGSLASLKVVPSRAVFLVNAAEALDGRGVDELVAGLPIQPQSVRWQGAEREKVSQDMFISLALENMKVFMIGGLILAVAGVFVVGLANFIAERRTFSLLRLRGLPLPLLLRISLSMFLVPVIVGAVLGVLLGALSGYGIAQAIWELPRIYGVAGFLENRLTFSLTAWGIVLSFGAILTLVAVGLGLWPFRRTAHQAIREG